MARWCKATGPGVWCVTVVGWGGVLGSPQLSTGQMDPSGACRLNNCRFRHMQRAARRRRLEPLAGRQHAELQPAVNACVVLCVMHKRPHNPIWLLPRVIQCATASVSLQPTVQASCHVWMKACVALQHHGLCLQNRARVMRVNRSSTAVLL